MADVRKRSVQWICDCCEAKLYGVQLVDDSGDRIWTMLPAGWWYYPVDYGDTDGEDGAAVMLYAFCSEKCIREALERAAVGGVVEREKKPLRTTIGELMKRRAAT